MLNKEEFFIKYKDRFWHQLSKEEVDEIKSIPEIKIGDILKTLKQPLWCSYIDALSFEWGCWSLCDTSPNGLRSTISENSCHCCEMFLKQK